MSELAALIGHDKQAKSYKVSSPQICAGFLLTLERYNRTSPIHTFPNGKNMGSRAIKHTQRFRMIGTGRGQPSTTSTPTHNSVSISTEPMTNLNIWAETRSLYLPPRIQKLALSQGTFTPSSRHGIITSARSTVSL